MIKTEEILIKGRKNKNFCDIFCYEPENIEEAALGNLYMVAELATEKESSQLVNLLGSLIKREYYCLPHRGPMESLEAGLKKANLTLNELANQGNLEWLGKLHFICAVLNKERELYLTQTGAAQAYLWREGRLASITKKIVPAPEKPHPAKTFQSVISGKIELTDKLIFSTPALFDFLSPPGFKQLFNLPKIENICDQINKLLREQKRPPSLGTLLIELEPEAVPETLSAAPISRTTPPIKLDEIIY
ncbi:MAG: Uncharacterized protein LiPW39_482 [Parcubacteria group bacterium LiPW_39]|nr:MAG: Uncharacterized protein LiPW39_482 [Parcubacteria group bacterium LiPW_39]